MLSGTFRCIAECIQAIDLHLRSTGDLHTMHVSSETKIYIERRCLALRMGRSIGEEVPREGELGDQVILQRRVKFQGPRQEHDR